MLNFTWDRRKAAANLRKHGVSFETATGVFNDPSPIDEIDDREDYGEEWSNIIGMVEGRLLFVTYTLRGGQTRIISARKATPEENRRYHEEES